MIKLIRFVIFQGNCDVKVSTRKNCQLCRFQKCLSVGMEKSWVMSDRERKEYNKQLEEKRKMKHGSQTTEDEHMVCFDFVLG